MAHACSGGVLHHVSPSQIKEFRRCKRKWYYTKVQHVPPPKEEDTAARDTGTAMHGETQEHFEAGKPVSHESIGLLLADPLVPKRSPSLLIEHPRDYKLGIKAAGVNVHGRIDLVDPTNPKHIHIWDWKSCGSFRYAQKPEALRRDTQLITYGHWAFGEFGAAEAVTLYHGYMRTDRAAYRIVATDPLPREHVSEVYSEIEETVHEMTVTAKAQAAEDVPGNPDACNDFGGCPYLDICPMQAVFIPDEGIDEAITPLAQRLAFRRSAVSSPPLSA